MTIEGTTYNSLKVCDCDEPTKLSLLFEVLKASPFLLCRAY
jgi:hypothetical protein